MHQRLVSDLLLILLNSPKQPLHANILKEDYQKALKKLTLFFRFNPIPFNRQSYQKQKGPGTNDQLLFRLQNKFRKIPLLAIYYVTKFDDII